MNPLNLPEGSVRATIALLAIIFLFVTGLIDCKEAFATFRDLALIIIGFYFGQRGK